MGEPGEPLRLDSLEAPGDRYELCETLGTGVCGEVIAAKDSQAANKRVAIKIQRLESCTKRYILEEYRVLKDLSGHPNLLDFYGTYRKKGKPDEIWFVLELCEGGSVTDLVRGMISKDRRMSEDHIAFILKETAKAVNHLHENQIMHRDIRGHNVLLTKEGEVKLADFGLCREFQGPEGKRGTLVGSPSWMAPEVVASSRDDDEAYSSRVDVWSLGIMAIELGDGKAPFQDMHPTRALFQIVRNPPPGLYRPANWTQTYNDFITECLEKNPENRPFMVELMEHPFFTELPENDFHLTQELKKLIADYCTNGIEGRTPEALVIRGFVKTDRISEPEKMYVEDLAALENLSEDAIIEELHHRTKLGKAFTFIGDILLSVNPNEDRPELYSAQMQAKYKCKSRSDNSPHIFAVADSAHQDMLHHEEPQHILLSGESYSGKTTNYNNLIKHLTVLGFGNSNVGPRVLKALNLLQVATHAGTPTNPNSTRCVLQTQLTFGSSGKLSGAIFWLYQLEKWRVSSTDMTQANFHLIYYFYDAMEEASKLEQYNLTPGRKYRYLRIPEARPKIPNLYCRDDPVGNSVRFKVFQQNLKDLEFSNEKQDTLWNLLAAIILLGDVRFKDGSARLAVLDNPETSYKVAELLKVDEKKFAWSLINYCYVEKGVAIRKKHTADEARDARDVLASTIYGRLVDWMVNNINYKLSFGRAVYGDAYCITLLDMFGFECFGKNRFEQLLVNSLNEQLQYHYNQRMFAWEMQEQEEEHVPVTQLKYYDNKTCVDQLMAKPDGLWYVADEASRTGHGVDFIIDSLKKKEESHVKASGGNEFTVAHYTGTVTYDARDIVDKNRDFLPPEMIETLRLSTEEIVKQLFTNKLSKSGNLTIAVEKEPVIKEMPKKSKWGAILVADKNTKGRKYNTLSRGEYSQTRRMRTAGATFRATALEILRGISIGGGSGGTFFIRCIRADLDNSPRGFQPDVVRQQLRALAILDTARARQKGFPHRIAFQEFLRRYKFLAFDFDENVDLTKDNCRLLLLRLKMEGWLIGQTKVFLKYYNEEYLSRLYEVQVKKIVKVQCMMRAFLAKRNVAGKLKKFRQDSLAVPNEVKKQESKEMTKDGAPVVLQKVPKEVKKQDSKEMTKDGAPVVQQKVPKEVKRQESKEMTEDGAALVLQKAYRDFSVRKQQNPDISKSVKLDEDTLKFMKHYCRVWKSRSIYQVLLHYRAARYQDLVNFSQQVHIFNQAFMQSVQVTNIPVLLNKIDPSANAKEILGQKRPSVWKLPFRLDQVPYFDTTFMCDPLSNPTSSHSKDQADIESWDGPLRRRPTISSQIRETYRDSNQTNLMKITEENLVSIPYCRDPSVPIHKLPPVRQATVDDNFSKSKRASASSKSYQPTRNESHMEECDDNISINSNQSAVYKKRRAPQPVKSPSPKLVVEDYSEPSGIRYSKTGHRNGNNPIKELQQMAARTHTASNSTEDSPPFNFQAILRKTNHNRNSMKRHSADLPSGNSFYSQGQYGDSTYSRGEPYVEANNDNVVFHSNARRSYSDGNWQNDNRPGRPSSSNSDMLNGRTVRTELAPGFIVEGLVSDL